MRGRERARAGAPGKTISKGERNGRRGVYFAPRLVLKPLPARNLTFVLAGLGFVVYSSPVKGFLAFWPPFCAGLTVLANVPTPLIETRSFFLSSIATPSNVVLMVERVSLPDMPVFFAT